MRTMKVTGITRMLDEPMGRVYLLEIILWGQTFYKIGATTISVESRIDEIEKVSLRKYSQIVTAKELLSFNTDKPLLTEALLHSRFNQFRVNMPPVCVGYTELFQVKECIYSTFNELNKIYK